MFVIEETRSAWWPVRIPVPCDNGIIEHVEIEMLFEALDMPDLTKLTRDADSIEREEISESDQFAEQLAAVVSRFTRDWKGVGTRGGAKGDVGPVPIDFNPANLRRLVNKPGVFAAIMTAYRRMLAGVPEERAKN